MPGYRMLVLNELGDVVEFDLFMARNDQEAWQHARHHLPVGCAIDVWRRRSQIKPEPAGRAQG